MSDDPLVAPSIEAAPATNGSEGGGLAALSPAALAEAIRRSAFGASKAPSKRWRGSHRMVQNAELSWLHRNWQLPLGFQPVLTRGGLARLRNMIRNRLARISYSYIERYLSQNQDIVANSVRVMDALAKSLDRVAEAEELHYHELRDELDEVVTHLRLLGNLRPEGLGAPEPTKRGEPRPTDGQHR